MTLPFFRLQRRQRAAAQNALGQTGKEIFCFPLPAPARIGMVASGFVSATNTKAFAIDDIRGLREYAPEALVLPLGLALSFAEQRLGGTLDLPSLTLAIVVLTSLEDAPMATHHRDLFWKAFGLPVFEQLRGPIGRVIARECEVHDGLHFDASATATVPPGFSAELVPEQCECGLETARLRHRITTQSRAAAA